MDAMLKLQKDAFPYGKKLHTSHYDAKKLLSKLGLSNETIHVCKYDCVLFWKEIGDLQSCQYVIQVIGRVQRERKYSVISL